PLMTPDEVMRLRPPAKQGQGDSEKIVAPGDMLIFVSGHYPINGKQVLYFADPEFTKRAAEPPPATFYAIEEGRVRRQRPRNRSANVLSKADLLGDDSPTASDHGGSPALEAFSFDTDVPAVVTGADSVHRSNGFLEQLELDGQAASRRFASEQ